MVAALLLLPVGVSESRNAAAGGDFLYSSGRIRGTFEVHDDGAGSYLLVPEGPRDRPVTWDLFAERLVVNWTNVTRYELARPWSPGASLGAIDNSKPVSGEKRFDRASATSTMSTTASQLMAIGLEMEPPNLWGRAGAATLRPQPDSHWRVGSMPNRTLGSPEADPAQFSVQLPPGTAQLVLAGATLTGSGNLQVVVWQANVTVDAGPGPPQEFASGTTARDSYAGPAGQPSLLRERVDQLLVLRAENATLRLQLNSGDAVLAAKLVALSGRVNATFEDADGLVRIGAEQFPMFDERLAVDGVLHLETWNQTGSDARLRGRLGISDGVLRTGSSEILVDAIRPEGSVSWPISATGAWLAMLGAALVSAVVVVVRRRPPTFEAVELALLGGHRRTAQRQARRLVAARPGDADAVFLLGATFLARAQYAQALVEVEPLAEKVPPSDRSGIAYVLAVAARAIGDHPRARRWAAEASREPLLLEQMKGNGGWAELKKPAEPGPESTALTPGYA